MSGKALCRWIATALGLFGVFLVPTHRTIIPRTAQQIKVGLICIGLGAVLWFVAYVLNDSET